MNGAEFDCVVFPPADLLPAPWRAAAGSGPVRTFNLALLRTAPGWIVAYRVVLPDGRRRLAFARLDPALQLVADSAVAFSDYVRFSSDGPYPEIVHQWLADPRLYRFGERCFVYWNSGWHEPRNHQFLQEFDPATLQPVGPPREMVLEGPRRPLEKNWTLFQAPGAHLPVGGNSPGVPLLPKRATGGASGMVWPASGEAGPPTGRCTPAPAGGLFAVYSVTPHRILQFSLEGEGDLRFSDAAITEWSLDAFPACHGGLRGGAPPALHDGRFWSFCHSVHDGPQGYCYAASAYCFAAEGTFAPLAEPLHPLPIAVSQSGHRSHPRLNPAVDAVIYPCGAVWDGTRWVISHGINDEQCAISVVPHAAVVAAMRPLTP